MRVSRPIGIVAVISLAVWASFRILCAFADQAEKEAREAERIAALLRLVPGQQVADIGAGDGEWTLHLAGKVGPTGHVYATEIKQDLVEKIGKQAQQAGLDNVSVILSGQRDAGLPANCCDAILIRKVYHHFTDPAEMNRQLLAALRPGGRVAIVDYISFLNDRVKGVPENRSGHGLESDILTREITQTGFQVDQVVQPWMDESNVYCVIARRPLPAPELP